MEAATVLLGVLAADCITVWLKEDNEIRTGNRVQGQHKSHVALCWAYLGDILAQLVLLLSKTRHDANSYDA